ncbi:MAG: tRNA uridine-5-carboxymethylaminomethyl(34) synthesis GTPase MnmE [Rhodocyclales bacterium]|nr:tRNA uridine-5-carboxymethylaminomethyl(34) synthesis GTPase MnmE [Rhodocyclales bacterium]
MPRSPAQRQPDVVVAVATPAGRGGVGVVRVSGPSLTAFATALLGHLPKPRHAGFVRFRDRNGVLIDEGLAIYFPGPQSFTGEDVLELQGHGSPVVMQMLVRRCLELGARAAEPGEFSRRAFVNGKMDLAQAEAVADLIDASTATAARAALRSLSGEFSRLVDGLRDELIDLRMLVEATLDFPEEELEFLAADKAFERLARVRAELERVLTRARHGALLRCGLKVVLVGQPNVGKSSLLNALAGDDHAIVTDIPGTTRDAVRVSLQIDGVPLHIVDTAGLRVTEDPVERIGMARTWQEIESADVVVRLLDARGAATVADETEAAILARAGATTRRLTVRNKIDLCAGVSAGVVRVGDAIVVGISAKTGAGISALRDELLAIAGWDVHEDDTFSARERHLDALRRAMTHLDAAQRCSRQLELLAEELRLAQSCVSEITGEFSTDDLLGVIFSRFCIGK